MTTSATNNKTENKKGSGKLVFVAIIVILLAIVAGNSFFLLYEGESAIVMRFGRIESVHMNEITYEVHSQLLARGDNITITTGTGIRFKIPFIDNVVKYTSRLIPYDSPPTEVLTRDRERLFFDNIAVWRIINPVLFYESYQTIDRAKQRINDILYAEIRVGVGTHDAYQIISVREVSNAMLTEITERVSRELFYTGIEVIDIRIRRTDLPLETFNSIHGRMNAERHRVAAENRAEGERENYRIRSETDRQVAYLITGAERTAEEIRGKGDARAAQIYNEAFSRNPQFFEFYNLLMTYRLTIGSGTTLVIPLDSPFAMYLLGVQQDLGLPIVNSLPPPTPDDGNGNGDDE